MLNLLSILAFLLAAFMAFGHKGSAASQAAGPTGITVSPALAQVAVAADESEHPLQFKITNNETTPRTIDLSAADFSTLDESGGLFFVGTNPTALQKKYGLAQWLDLPVKTVTVLSKQTVTINASILNLPTFTAGGHYGALLLSLTGSQPSAQSNSIGLHPIASSLLFVSKLGGDTHQLSLADVYMKRTLFSPPGNITVRFHNDGNTHLVPRGEVTITGPGNKLISKGIINQNSGIVLPQTFRRYPVQLSKISTSDAPGQYQLRVDFRFDGYNQFRRYQASFWVIPAYLAAIIAALVVINLAVIGLYFRARRQKKPKTKKIKVRVD